MYRDDYPTCKETYATLCIERLVMRFAASMLSFVSFFLVSELIPAPMQLQARQFFGSSSEARQTSAAFRKFGNRRVKRTALDISIAPAINKIRPRTLKLVNGDALVLSIPIEIKNYSAKPVTMKLAHEWYGGVWPPTDLVVAVKMKQAGGEVWVDGPGYQVGEDGSVAMGTRLKPGETKSFDIRLNWPGTGSVPTEPLIDESKPGKYSIKFLLVFRANAGEEYLETQAFEVEVERDDHDPRNQLLWTRTNSSASLLPA